MIMPDKDIKRSIANVRTTLAVEGLHMKKRSVIYGRKYLKGHMSSDDVIQEITRYILNKNKKIKR